MELDETVQTYENVYNKACISVARGNLAEAEQLLEAARSTPQLKLA